MITSLSNNIDYRILFNKNFYNLNSMSGVYAAIIKIFRRRLVTRRYVGRVKYLYIYLLPTYLIGNYLYTVALIIKLRIVVV